MPRLVKIPECTHEVFAKIRGAFLEHAPWAIRNDIFDNDKNTAYFMFEDSDYIPFLLHPFIVAPPFDKEKLNLALNQVGGELEIIKEQLGWVKQPKIQTGSSDLQYYTIPETESEEEFEGYLEGLPQEIKEKLRKERQERKENKQEVREWKE